MFVCLYIVPELHNKSQHLCFVCSMAISLGKLSHIIEYVHSCVCI